MIYIDKLCFFKRISNLKPINENIFPGMIKVDNLELYKTLFDFFLSFLCITTVKDILKDCLKGKFKKYKNFEKKSFRNIVILLIGVIIIMFIIAQWLDNLIGLIICILGIILFIPLIFSSLLLIYSDLNNMEELLESFFLILLINILGLLVSVVLSYIKIIPNFSFFKFYSKYLLLIFGEIFRLTDNEKK